MSHLKKIEIMYQSNKNYSLLVNNLRKFKEVIHIEVNFKLDSIYFNLAYKKFHFINSFNNFFNISISNTDLKEQRTRRKDEK